jgi:diaminohydroxyphosphoribosylaminopyrimidine deaminase/5-amino-6-(5-phosphoribosylamino)uracil reductase
LIDNPQLNIRDWTGKAPTRIIIDRTLKIPTDFHVFDGTQRTIICTEVEDVSKYVDNITYKVLNFETSIPQQISSLLYEEQIQSVIIEGGCKTLESFIDNNLWDEARIFKGATTFKKGIKAPKISGKIKEQIQISTDQLNILKP